MDSLCAQVLSPYCLVCTLDCGRDCIRRTHWESLGALGSVWELLGTFGQSPCLMVIVVPDGHEGLFIVFT